MTETDADRPDDSWMTVAEFAAALRVRPVTVRSWITKGQLTATRAGQRKWLVRRAELARMLGPGDGGPAVPPPPRPYDEPPPKAYDAMAEDGADRERERQEQDYAIAVYEWDVALERSRMAPPDARFPSRIRQIAEAAAGRGAAIKDWINEPGFEWRPIPDSAGMTLSYELRPDGNRPGPKDAWDRVDRVVARLGIAMEGTSASAVATAMSDLATALREVADAIESRGSGAPGHDAGTASAPSGV
jgi:excisionase family DNA binding protein